MRQAVRVGAWKGATVRSGQQVVGFASYVSPWNPQQLWGQLQPPVECRPFSRYPLTCSPPRTDLCLHLSFHPPLGYTLAALSPHTRGPPLRNHAHLSSCMHVHTHIKPCPRHPAPLTDPSLHKAPAGSPQSNALTQHSTCHLLPCLAEGVTWSPGGRRTFHWLLGMAQVWPLAPATQDS
ncbi:hypothetical protein HJG60_009837 [Phyllostomus discolor]|uniref:Uncharacterized protein n=1 Tax=Phyllostomus discolor TaxID=89673 RepID=A0A834B2M6_9CHIR|nr:hypothetical protein HJG60_009837 [Phyllostomus discolor]